jgi:hypothetical protein
MRDIPFPAPIAESSVILLGSNSFFCPLGEEERESGFLSLDLDRDRDRDIVSRKACFSDDPRGNEVVVAVFVAGVSSEKLRLIALSLPLSGVVSDGTDNEDRSVEVSLVESTAGRDVLSKDASIWN